MTDIDKVSAIQLVRAGEGDLGRTGLVAWVGDEPHIVDVADNLGHLDSVDISAAASAIDWSGPWSELIRTWDQVRPTLEALRSAAEADASDIRTSPRADVVLRAPLPRADHRVFALGANFGAHVPRAVQEKKDGLGPWGFVALPGTVIATGDQIVRPRDTKFLDYEVEAAAVLAAEGADLESGTCQVWGVTAWHDVSIRDSFLGEGHPVDRGAYTWTLAKNFDGSNVCGPVVTVVDETVPVDRLQLSCQVNGQTRQDGSLSDMVYSFGDVAAFISRFMSLRPGDMILSGTPGGTAVESGRDGQYLDDGDEIVVDVEHVGRLRNQVASR